VTALVYRTPRVSKIQPVRVFGTKLTGTESIRQSAKDADFFTDTADGPHNDHYLTNCRYNDQRKAASRSINLYCVLRTVYCVLYGYHCVFSGGSCAYHSVYAAYHMASIEFRPVVHMVTTVLNQKVHLVTTPFCPVVHMVTTVF
jgi:hypothetical protein